MIRSATALCALLTLALAACGPSPQSGWRLQPDVSRVSFVSVKNRDVAEIGHFGVANGGIDAEGHALLTIQAASVETYVEIRDQRLRDLFFQSGAHPAITIAGQIDLAAFSNLEPGEAMDAELDLTVTLVGVTRTIYADVRVIRAGPRRVIVTTVEPAIVSAADFGLTGAIDALRLVAGLDSVSATFPVFVYLVFEPD